MPKKELENVVETSMELDPDVAELASIYRQLEYYLSACEKIVPTSESLHSMAVSIFINRNDLKRQEAYRNKTDQHTKESQTKLAETGSARICPSCNRVINYSLSKDGKTQFYACWDCGLFINEDLTTTPMKKKSH